MQRLLAIRLSTSVELWATLKMSGQASRLQFEEILMKAWLEKLIAQFNALLAPPLQPVRIRSDEQRRLAEERRRRR